MAFGLDISVTQDLNFAEIPFFDQNQIIPEHPTWIIGISRRINKSDKLISKSNTIKKPLLELPNRSNNPAITQVITWCSWRCRAFGWLG